MFDLELISADCRRSCSTARKRSNVGGFVTAARGDRFRGDIAHERQRGRMGEGAADHAHGGTARAESDCFRGSRLREIPGPGTARTNPFCPWVGSCPRLETAKI